MANNRKLGRVSSHRKAMLRNLATDVIMHGKIETTATRAKEVRKVVDKLITLGIRGDLHARRQAAAILQNVVDPATGKTAVQVLFDDVAPKFKGKNGILELSKLITVKVTMPQWQSSDYSNHKAPMVS